MKLLYALSLTLLLSGIAAAQAQQLCFMNSGLKDEERVYMTINGTQVFGEFIIEREYDAQKTETYAFTGAKAGNTVRVKFGAGKTPDSLARDIGNFVWTLLTTPGRDALRIQRYGRDYNTSQYSNYNADYESCEPGYAALAKSARRVSFARGAASAGAAVALRGRNERKSFLLNLRKGQGAAVSAAGCGISFFYPDKSRYEEGIAIDAWSSNALPQSGDYLFVISPAGLPGNCNVTFSAK